ncbi:hypothetical protein AAG906_040794 [Vitis piasezkii]
MSLPTGSRYKSGQCLGALIQVDHSPQSSDEHGFNLNFPSETCWAEAKEIINLNLDPVECGQ